MKECNKPLFRVVDNAYKLGGPWVANNTKNFYIDLLNSGNWYDFTVTSDCHPGEWMVRYMGRMETG